MRFNNRKHSSWKKAFEAFQRAPAQAKPNAVWHGVCAKHEDTTSSHSPSSSGIVSRWNMWTCASLFGTAMAQHCIVTLPETPCACFCYVLHPVQQNASLCGGRYSLRPQPAWCGHGKKLITFCFDSHAQHDSLDEFDLLHPVVVDSA
jgi:hypothetical protein